jgi:hypothetical protein
MPLQDCKRSTGKFLKHTNIDVRFVVVLNQRFDFSRLIKFLALEVVAMS